MIVINKTSASLIIASAGAVGLYLLSKRSRKISESSIEIDKDAVYDKRVFTKLIRIPRRAVGAVLGRHGNVIRRIEFETKTFLQVIYYDKREWNNSRAINRDQFLSWNGEFEEESWDETDRRPMDGELEHAFLRIQAHSERQVHLVSLAVRGILRDFMRDRVVQTIEVPNAAVGLIIGKDGNNIKRIMHMCKVRIQVSQTGNDREQMEIRGTDEGVAAAILRIEASVAKSSRLDSFNQGLEGDEEAGDPDCEDLDMDLENIEKLRELLSKEEEMW